MGTIHRFQGTDGTWAWEGVPLADYGASRPGVTVQRFISRQDNSSNMEIRYFELQAGSCSNYEKHNYEHAVLVLRGKGIVQIGDETHEIGFGDSIFIESDDVHRFIAGDESPLGFMCAVLDKELRFAVHGEQDLILYDDTTGKERSRKHWKNYSEQVK